MCKKMFVISAIMQMEAEKRFWTIGKLHMEIEYDDVKLVSGAYFQALEEPIKISNETEKIAYMICLRNELEKRDVPAMHKFIRMFAYPYRMVLIDDGNRESVGFVVFGDEEDKEELVSTMNWIARLHPMWRVYNCQHDEDVPKIIGHRIANNMFHAKKLSLQGEMLDPDTKKCT